MDATIDAGGAQIFYREEGAGTPVLLLHGAPDSGALWRHQIPSLQAAGYRTIVPDLRGFGRSSMPADVSSYRLVTVLGDIVNVLRHAGVGRVHVVAHDWGGQVGWLLASLSPRTVDHLVVLASAHPAELWNPPVAQRELAWYMHMAQSELAEELVRRDDFALLRAIVRSRGDIDAYVRDLARPGALTAWLHWYRANAGPAFEAGPPPRLPQIAAPTLAVSSPGDHFFIEDVIRTSARHVSGPWEHHSLPGTSHWMPLDAPDEVNALLLGFLGRHPTTPPPRRARAGSRS